MTSFDSYINDPRFSRIFDLPPEASEKPVNSFKIQYADYGYRNEANPQEENVFLFFGSLMGLRLIHIAKDEVAKSHKIRIINPDRPGIGGTDAADTVDRMKIWSEALLALLRHLKIQHVSVGCHSGGTIYALDMLLHHPEILHPSRPYLAIGAPWVLPSHTDSAIMSIIQSLPAGIIAKTDKIAHLIRNYIGPTLGISFGLTGKLINKQLPAASAPQDKPANCDCAKFEEDLWPEIIQRIYSEGLKGISSDAALFTKKAKFYRWME